MKKSSFGYFCFFGLVLFSLILNVYAASKYVILMDAVNIRKGAGTNYGVYTTAKLGSKYYLNSEEVIEDTSGGCSSGWYEINYNGSSGYVCSDYVKVYDEENLANDREPTTACEILLAQKGFPSSYFVPLCVLHTEGVVPFTKYSIYVFGHPEFAFNPVSVQIVASITPFGFSNLFEDKFE